MNGPAHQRKGARHHRTEMRPPGKTAAAPQLSEYLINIIYGKPSSSSCNGRARNRAQHLCQRERERDDPTVGQTECELCSTLSMRATLFPDKGHSNAMHHRARRRWMRWWRLKMNVECARVTDCAASVR